MPRLSLRFPIVFSLLLPVLLLAACDDDKGSKAVEKCERLLGQFCSGLIDCGFYDEMDSCLDDAAVILDCSLAVGVSDDFGDCLNEVEAQSCDAFKEGTLPVSCEGAVYLDGTSDRETTQDPAAAVAFCRDLHETYCRWVVACEPTISTSDCLLALAQEIDCDTAVSVDEDASQCLEDLPDYACDLMGTLPDSCQGILLYL